MENSLNQTVDNHSHPQGAGSAGTSQAANRNSGSFVHGGLFTLFVIELVLLGMVLWYFIVNRHSFPNNISPLADPIWGMLTLIAAGWGTWFLVQSHLAAKQWQFADSIKLLMIVIASGAIVLGILLLHVARTFVPAAIVMDMRSQYAAADIVVTEPSAALVGVAVNGKKWFSMSCVTCHGLSGDGVANAAPSLRSSEFRKTSDEATIAALIRNGRAATDPANKTGKVMPAKGGNPFLTEDKIADLVAFLKDLENQLPGGSTGAVATASVATGNTDLPEASNEPLTVVKQWKLADLENLDVTPTEDSVALGAAAFTKATCNKCHMAAVAGKELGPTLDKIATKYKRDQLLQHIVEPSKEINENFQNHLFVLFDGQTVSGVVVSENEEEIRLLTDLLKPEALKTIPVDDIDDQAKSKLSPMPEGLVNVLTQPEIAGLVAYLDVTGRQMAAATAPQLSHWVVPEAAHEATATTWSPAVAERLRVQRAKEEARSVATQTTGIAGSVGILATSASERAGAFLGTHPQTWTEIVKTQNNSRYQFSFGALFVIATSLLAFHFLWVVGTGTAVVAHRELQLTSAVQLKLGRQVFLFWMLGMGWLTIWFLIFFVIG